MKNGTENRALHPAWGWIALGFFATHGVALVLKGEAAYLLWSCHLGCVVLAAGIWWAKPVLVGTAFLWMVVGLPLWLASVLARGGDFVPTSILTHVCGLGLSIAAIRAAGWRRGTWAWAMLGLIALWLGTRFAYRGDHNVNLTRDFWFGWEGEYVGYPLYLVVIAFATAAVFFGVEKLVTSVRR